MDLEGLDLNPDHLRAASAHFLQNLSVTLSESLQKYLDDTLDDDLSVQVRVKIEAVSVKTPTS